MLIGLLGPLIVSSQGVELRVPAGRQRSLLAALAARADDVIAIDVLADLVWDGSPPRSWRVTIRNYVRRLREVLGHDVGSLILTRSPGYLFRAGSEEVDMLRFAALCKQGRLHARAGDWQHASASFTAADVLWRGVPFADIPSQRLRDDYVPYLTEARLSAIEARIDADLRVCPSRAADVIVELQQLTRHRPEREQVKALLMLALYRCGRQGEALAAYRDAWRYSTRELGMEPGPQLAGLHQRILDRDPRLLAVL
jgi:DNA-binding SARP family transcriptional activator